MDTIRMNEEEMSFKLDTEIQKYAVFFHVSLQNGVYNTFLNQNQIIHSQLSVSFQMSFVK